MPDKPLTVITYAASASLAAAALVYFFNPNHIIDGEQTESSSSSRKKGIVGLHNPANDCFINSVLQSLAGLRELRLYLIRELHRRSLDEEIYRVLPPPPATPQESQSGREIVVQKKKLDPRKQLSLQEGEVTKGLKVMLDRLNERPIYKKTITAAPFVMVLERAFGTRISKAQQDAQELLQIVAERLSEEYHAGRNVRKRARRDNRVGSEPEAAAATLLDAEPARTPSQQLGGEAAAAGEEEKGKEKEEEVEEEEDGFPMEGRMETQIECQHCHFTPRASPHSFVMLTLPVPQKSSTTLAECFDSHFKTEYIDDYKCDRCRLQHAHDHYAAELRRARTEPQRRQLTHALAQLDRALRTDPEQPPADVPLPDSRHAPARRIARHSRVVAFPNVLVVHLSRSIYDAASSSTKNTARVSFPELLPVGGLLHRRRYRLLGVVAHKGTHNSGHYETFRRQHLYAPVPHPHADPARGPYSRTGSRAPTPSGSGAPSPRLGSRPSTAASASPAAAAAAKPLSPDVNHFDPHQQTPPSSAGTAPSSASTLPSSAPSPSKLPQRPASGGMVEGGAGSFGDASASKSRRGGRTSRSSGSSGHSERWWRISDEKVKECKTGDVLGMQREVYLLFYEIEKGERR